MTGWRDSCADTFLRRSPSQPGINRDFWLCERCDSSTFVDLAPLIFDFLERDKTQWVHRMVAHQQQRKRRRQGKPGQAPSSSCLCSRVRRLLPRLLPKTPMAWVPRSSTSSPVLLEEKLVRAVRQSVRRTRKLPP